MVKDIGQLHKSLDPATMGAWPVRQLAADSTTDFDLFLTIGTGLHLYARAPYRWTEGEIERLQAQGIQLLYYSITDRDKVEAYGQLTKLAPLPADGSPDERLAALIKQGGELLRVLYHYPLGESALVRVREVGEAMVETVLEDPACIGAIGKLSAHDDYTYFHSVRVAAYGLAIAIHQSQRSREELRDLALGCLLHDIGKAKIDLSILNKPGSLDPQEWELVQNHPTFGGEMVADSRLSLVGKGIITGHHERLDGRGYPNKLGKNEIMFEVRIAAFADVFDALTTNRPYQQSLSRFEALNLIRHKLLAGLDKEIYRSVIELFDQKVKTPS